VSAQNDAGFGDPSNIARATTEDDDEKEEPRAPRNLRAEADGDSAIDLTWRAPSDDGGSAITRYRVDVSDDNEGWSILVDTAAQITSYKHSGLDPGAKWYYRVRASNSVGSGAWSSVANATTESEDSASVPDAPTDLIAEASGDRIDLDWDAPAENGGSDITGYRIE